MQAATHTLTTKHSLWRPSWGATPRDGGTEFRVWAPEAAAVSVVFERRARNVTRPLVAADGVFSGWVPEVWPGTRYAFELEPGRALPDPASRWQPEGPHGRSAVVNPWGYAWADDKWTGLDPRRLVIYELHVGAFTREGTFAGVERKLDALVDLGITALELMPIAEFAGRRNWGYDGVALFAPSHHYGSPDDLRRLVDAAHQRGLGIILDVVYNHLGPDGAYVATYAPQFFTDRHHTPWGDAVNLDGPGCEMVRSFLLENALHWVHEYHVDGLRLDATHALYDDSPTHFLAELGMRLRHSLPRGRSAVLIAEDERNEAALVRPLTRQGLGLDGVWADDFHHEVRRIAAGDAEGYFRSYRGDTRDLARTITQGWLFTGQVAAHSGEARGTDPTDVGLERFVICIQNHDQVGNRAFGDRLSHAVDAATYRAASALMLLAPETPLLFMGQEWAASSPFQFFTDHHDELGEAVTRGRRQEFSSFSAFSDPEAREKIPDPQAEDTFERSRLLWEERDLDEHATVLALYRTLLHIRAHEPSFDERERERLHVAALDDDTVAIRRLGDRGSVVVVRLRGSGSVVVPLGPARPGDNCQVWKVALTTEEDRFAIDPQPPIVEWAEQAATITFPRPAAVVLTPR
jgi:maltooligosyltrehalose trehalohydrolase